MQVELVILFLLVAILYSSIGFGGGSSYLAILSLYAFDPSSIKLVALFCNITVVLGASILYYRSGLIKFRKLYPLIILSIPFSFLGGRIRLSDDLYLTILGFILIIAGILMMIDYRKELKGNNDKVSKVVINSGIGGFVGFVSGLVGIGGGIFLSPILYLQHWDRAKIIAATSTLFILVNSVSGILGTLSMGLPTIDLFIIFQLLLAVFIGGQIGTRISILKLKGRWIKLITGLLIIFVGLKLLSNMI